MQTAADWTGKLFMYTVGSYPGMDKILPALLDKRVFSGILIEFLSLEPLTYVFIVNILVSNLFMPIVQWFSGAFLVYSLWFNDDFYDLVFEGIYGSMWTLKVPDAISTYMPGFDDYLEANPRPEVVETKKTKAVKKDIKVEEFATKTEDVAPKSKKVPAK